MTNAYITPTKENPIFTARCNWFGPLEGIYKESIVEFGNVTSCMSTYGLSLSEAIVSLLNYATDEKEYLLSENNTKLFIEMVDGTIKGGEVNHKKVFTLTSSQIKLL